MELNSTFAYEPGTGIVRWLIHTRGHGGLIHPGDEAGTIRKDGRVEISYKDARYLRSRLAWFLMKGEWPSEEVDHRNLNPGDDSWDNLRLATSSQQKMNTRLRRDNTSGEKGVCFRDPTRGWTARISVNGKQVNLGNFKNKDDAIAMRRAAAAAAYGDFVRT